MQAQLSSNKHIDWQLTYHENKVKKGKAECIEAANFIKDLKDLTREDKRYHFNRLNSLNENISKPTLQFSIDFHPSEHFSNEQLTQIARAFMQGMGMDHQPYLVYRHDDAFHPHIHVLVPRVQPNGQRTEIGPKELHRMHTLVREIEEQRHMVPLGGSQQRQDPDMPTKRIVYGQMPTFAAINQVLQRVVFSYAYTSMEELNAALRLYNVEAYGGHPGSKLNEVKGLIYRIIENGRIVGTPIKASDFTGRPTLRRLEQKFIENGPIRDQHRDHLKGCIEWAFHEQKLSVDALKQKLAEDGIATIFDAHDQVFFIDHERRAIFEGAALGERYQALFLKERCVPVEEYRKDQELKRTQEQRRHLNLGL